MSDNISTKEEYIKYLFHSKLSEGLLCVIIPDISERENCEISEGSIHWRLFESICLGDGLSYEMITEINQY